MASLIKQYRGRVVDSPGDNVLAEFASVVEAVEYAVEIQRRLKTENAELPEDRRMEFRIGVNLGDVMEDEDHIYGDGVNIAARVEGLAEGGGICISGTAYDQVENKLAAVFEYMGEHAVKNIKKPVRVYRVRMDTNTVLPMINGEPHLPEEPSIAILPFVNMSGDPAQEYFSDGITEEIITGLSKVPNLFVIARNSSFRYKGKAVNAQQVGRELGVRYLLEGSVRKAGNRVRITGQLIDATTGLHLWAERYDRTLEDIFTVQDEITVNIMKAMQVKLTQGEQACEWLKHGTQNYEAYEKSMKGMACFRRFSPEGIAQARQLFEEASLLDPASPGSHVMLAWVEFVDVLNGWSISPAQSVERGLELAQKAIALDDSQADAYSLLGNLYLLKRQFDRAVVEAQRAVALNPNGADHRVWLAMIMTSTGRPEKAISLIEKALRMNPFPPNWYSACLADAYAFTGQHHEAVSEHKKAIERSSDFLSAWIGLTASLIHSGREDEARAAAREVLRIDPNFSLEEHQKGRVFQDQTVLGWYLDALRRAGLK